jgi:hypothetical protein
MLYVRRGSRERQLSRTPFDGGVGVPREALREATNTKEGRDRRRATHESTPPCLEHPGRLVGGTQAATLEALGVEETYDVAVDTCSELIRSTRMGDPEREAVDPAQLPLVQVD